MKLTAVSPTSALLPVGGQWLIDVCVRNDDGYPAAATLVVTVTLPGGTTATPAAVETTTGRYRVLYVAGTAGRYVARVVTNPAADAVDFAAYVATTTAGTGMPDTDDVAGYLGTDAASWETEELQDALDAEAAAQRARCRVSAVYPADLRQALLRRVQRNLAMRRLPLAVLQGDAETGNGVLPGRDPEVRRLEAPHRKRTVG